MKITIEDEGITISGGFKSCDENIVLQCVELRLLNRYVVFSRSEALTILRCLNIIGKIKEYPKCPYIAAC